MNETNETIKIEERIDRDTNAMPCPKCNGYADRVDCTKEEIQNQGCGRNYECCGRAFVCRICKTRITGIASAPEME
jgi:hypothetical protein